MPNKFVYWFYSVINSIVHKASTQAKLHSFKKSATFDSSVVISPLTSIINWQNDKSKINIGSNSVISGTLIVFGFGGRIEIGKNIFIGSGSQIWSAKSVHVGNYVLISYNVSIIDNISHPINHEERRKDWDHVRTIGPRRSNDFDLKEQAIFIDDDAWIGHNATIMKGVTIGKGAIIGSNSVITKDVPPFAIVVGNPQRIIGYST